MPFKKLERPIILGIVGDSASGKSTLADGIAQILGADRVVTICTDDYHSLSRAARVERGVTALSPEANYTDILEQHIGLLRQGRPILKPVYNHVSGDFDTPQYVRPKEFIILEGLLGYSTRQMRDCYDVKIFLEPHEALRIKWKIKRDTHMRGYTVDEARRTLARRVEDSVHCILPQRTFADMVVSFYPPDSNHDESGAHLNVRHTLRPTLPHPDLTPVLEVGAMKKGFRLELARDIDGKPVDVLDISGDIDGKRAKAVEDLLWNLIPEAQHLRENVGKFYDDQNQLALSHPLALSQLLVTYHMIKAAQGHHAI
ncbi:phosphoribulokinase [Varunaivibrio sulfuroxidans]|uniref:phosphoribulokinase n=1 Tax=Varunaivibrio sulfuroxidans TaxID=1773489 RepID=A0A4R3JEF5_9PROT|nr:phosphoribulokinase [Varunaivibrio sulfuroxidans]TCS64272.1 phosphoribulokinase [Varunaivibrio sulfuroxidans]WES31290.1 phosphoribulokinase [Varunaivibrio sulfuroxidans]